MKKTLLVLIMPFMLWTCQQSKVDTSSNLTDVEATNDGVFIHISTGFDNPHRLLMALSMANRMAEDKDVLVYMDIEAVKVMIQGAEPIAMDPFGDHFSLVNSLISKGINVMVCPSCLEVAGYTPDDLIEGAQIANKEQFFGFTKGRILSLDY